MKHVSLTEATIKQNSDSCEVAEFGGIDTIDGADITIHGRYPEQGFAMNEKSDMVARIFSGKGKLVTKDKETTLRDGDVIFVGHGEAYFFTGQNIKLFMVCTPAWNLAQYREVED
jgi:mannose-6-phosphate isomerase-like protein (cupin superfamily)